ncbi:MAG: MauE/DoxX family redox-associated membrane protein [Myxococcales bacterium]|jgi:hypothetical protein
MIDPVIELSLCLCLALLFAGAAWHKISDRPRFEAVMRAYELLPDSSLPVASWLVPVAEASIALGLSYGPARSVAAWCASTVLLLYAGAIGVNLVRGRRDIDCGCFASSSRVPLGVGLVARNVGLAMAAWVASFPARPRALVWVDWVTVGTSLIGLSLLWLVSQRLAQTGPALKRLRGYR